MTGMTGENALRAAIRLAQQGRAHQAYRDLQKITRRDPQNVHAWMWLAYVAPNSNEKRAALRQARALQPQNADVEVALHRLVAPPHIYQAVRSGVFISYARADELFAIDLVDVLNAREIRAWLDITQIDPHTTWHTSIATALRNCGLMLMILSPAALRSEDVDRERQWFWQTGKIILPVLHADCDFESLNLAVPPVDFRASFDLGVQQLLQILLAPAEVGRPN
jgi:hypothetical protein